ncbi:conserved hypothetical protein, partial [Ricinus communis]
MERLGCGNAGVLWIPAFAGMTVQALAERHYRVRGFLLVGLVEVLGAGGRVFRHFGVGQFALRVGEQRGAAVVAELDHVALAVLLDLRDARRIQ